MKISGSTPNHEGMFGYYINGQRKEKFPLFLRGDGEVKLAILRGVNVDTSRMEIRISPTYQPLFIFQKVTGGFRIELFQRRLTVFFGWPPVRVQKLEGFPNEIRF